MTIVRCFGKIRDVGIGDYLLYAIAFRWISKLTYCTNPKGDKNDYLWDIIKDYDDKLIWNEPVYNCIQLVCNTGMDFPEYYSSEEYKEKYLNNSIKEPEVPFLIIPTVKDVKYDGDFAYAILAQSPNYTPASADFILEIFKEYIEIS